MDPFLIGSIGSSLLGGLFAKKSQKSQLAQQESQFDRQMQMAGHNLWKQEEALRSGIRWRAEDAKLAGLHPLAAMGANTGGFSPVSVSPTAMPMGSPMGDAMGQISQALGNQVGQKQQSALVKKQMESLDAQIAESRSRTLLNASQARRPIYGPPPAVTGVTSGLEGLDPGKLGDRGVRREPTPDMPARQKVSLGGQTAQGPNPEAFEVGLSELIAGALIYGPQWVYGWARDSHRKAKPKSGTPGWESMQTEGW